MTHPLISKAKALDLTLTGAYDPQRNTCPTKECACPLGAVLMAASVYNAPLFPVPDDALRLLIENGIIETPSLPDNWEAFERVRAVAIRNDLGQSHKAWALLDEFLTDYRPQEGQI